MSENEIFEFPSFNGEHPYAGILLVPWNYSPCVLVAASWCLTHTTPISKEYFINMSIRNPYKVVAGCINTYYQNTYNNQISLGINAVFHPNPQVAFVLIKLIPEFRRTLFVDYQLMEYNSDEPVRGDCECTYWKLMRKESKNGNFFYQYQLMNQIPCPYTDRHYSNSTACPIFRIPTISTNKNADLSATILCQYHLMGFVEFSYENGGSTLYHRITTEVITWIRERILV